MLEIDYLLYTFLRYYDRSHQPTEYIAKICEAKLVCRSIFLTSSDVFYGGTIKFLIPHFEISTLSEPTLHIF